MDLSPYVADVEITQETLPRTAVLGQFAAVQALTVVRLTMLAQPHILREMEATLLGPDLHEVIRYGMRYRIRITRYEYMADVDAALRIRVHGHVVEMTHGAENVTDPDQAVVQARRQYLSQIENGARARMAAIDHAEERRTLGFTNETLQPQPERLPVGRKGKRVMDL